MLIYSAFSTHAVDFLPIELTSSHTQETANEKNKLMLQDNNSIILDFAYLVFVPKAESIVVNCH